MSTCINRTWAVTITLATAGVGASPAVGADMLWERAVALVSANEAFVPRSVFLHLEERNPAGELKSTRESWYRFARAADGRVSYDLVRELVDGVQQKDRRGDDGGQESGPGQVGTPFDANAQAGVTATPSGERQIVGGVQALGYRFEQTTDQDRVLRGEAWLSAEGVPLRLEYTIDPLPRFVTALGNRMTFDTANGRWFMVEMNTRASIVALVYRRSFVSQLLLSDHFDAGLEAPPAS